jgi:hypothetical protein
LKAAIVRLFLVFVETFSEGLPDQYPWYLALQLLGMSYLGWDSYTSRPFYNQNVNNFRAGFTSAAVASMFASIFNVYYPLQRSWLFILSPVAVASFLVSFPNAGRLHQNCRKQTILSWQRSIRETEELHQTRSLPRVSRKVSKKLNSSNARSRKESKEIRLGGVIDKFERNSLKDIKSVNQGKQLMTNSGRGTDIIDGPTTDAQLISLIEMPPKKGRDPVFRSPMHVESCTCWKNSFLEWNAFE